MQGNISRRDLIKKSAVAGGVVWAAPTLLAQPAFASHGSHCGVDPCQNYCRVKIDPTGGTYAGGVCETGAASGGFFCVTTVPDPQVTCCPGTGLFTVTGTAASGFTITVTSTLCKLVSAFAKQGQDCIPVTVTNCAVATFTGESSHLEFLICCRTS